MFEDSEFLFNFKYHVHRWIAQGIDWECALGKQFFKLTLNFLFEMWDHWTPKRLASWKRIRSLQIHLFKHTKSNAPSSTDISTRRVMERGFDAVCVCVWGRAESRVTEHRCRQHLNTQWETLSQLLFPVTCADVCAEESSASYYRTPNSDGTGATLIPALE